MKKDMPPLEGAELASLLHRLPVGIVIQDASGKVIWVNETFEAQVGMSAGELLGGRAADLPLSPTENGAPEGTLYHLAGGLGSAEWLARHGAPLDLQGGQSVSFFVDITEAERARLQVDRLRQAVLGQVSTDELTGLLSRRAVMNQLEAQVSRSRRYQNPLSVMLIRLYCAVKAGEPPNKQGVVAFSRLLRDQTRWPDIIGRWDEHEFLLVLPETTPEAAQALQGKLAEALSGLHVVNGNKPFTCTAEFGIAGWQRRDDPSVLLERAAGALGAHAEGV